MIKEKVLVALISLLTTFVSIACFSPYKPQDFPGLPDGGNQPAEEVDDLFLYNEETGITIFHTNDIRYSTPYGYTLWRLNDTESPGDFTSRTATLSKPLGDTAAGYGLIFCYSTVEGIGNVFLTVMINNNRQYAIGRVVNGVYESIEWWAFSEALNGGKGVPNTIRIQYSNDTELFTLFLNGSSVRTFADTKHRLTAGKNGYVVVISPLDKFPATSVRVLFEE